MKYYAYLQRFYQLYANILFKCPSNTFLKALVSIFSFLQFFFIAIDIHLPSLLFKITRDSPIIYHIQSVFYFLPWIYATKSLLLDSIIFFIFHIISFILLFHAKFLSSKRKCIPHLQLVFIEFYQSVFVPFICYAHFYRLSLLIEVLITNKNLKSWFSFFICLANIIFCFIHLFFDSIFFSFIVFVPKTIFDTYDGKTNIILYFSRLLFCVGAHLIDLTNSLLIISLISVAFLCISIFLFYKRILLSVHYSFLSEYLEISPFFTISITIFIHIYVKKHSLVVLAVIIIYILTLFFLRVFHQYLTRESFRFLNVLKKGEDLPENSPQIIRILPGNIVSILRQITSNSGDPTIFMSILSQHHYTVKTSPMIEIIRFLSIFPSKRVDMITKLSLMKSSSNYNRFIIYFFLKSLRSLTSVSDEKHTIYLDELQRSFLVHQYMYWKSRERKKYYKSFKEACATSYYFIETKFEIMSLIERFPFDGYLYSRYADFSLIGYGNFEQYQKSMIVSANLDRDRNLITDPILHQTIKTNAQVLQYCNSDEIIVSMPVKSSQSSSDNEIPIASYVKPSRRMIPFFPFIQVLISIILFLIYFCYSIPFEAYSQSKYKNINDESPLLDFVFKKVVSLMLTSYSIPKYILDNFTKIQDISLCMESFDDLYRYMYNFYLTIPQIQSLSNYSVFFYQDYFYQNMVRNRTICQSLNNLTFAFSHVLNVYLDNLHDQFNSITKIVKSFDNRVRDEKKNFMIEISLISVIIFVSIIYIILIIIQSNWVFRKNPNVIKFLCSKKRITSLLFERCLESWEDLYLYISSKRLKYLYSQSKNQNSSRINNFDSFSEYSSESSSRVRLNRNDYSSSYEDSGSSSVSASTTRSSRASATEPYSNDHDYSISSESAEAGNKNNAKMNDNKSSQKDKVVNQIVSENVELKTIENEINIDEENQNDNESNEDMIKMTIEVTMNQKPLNWLTILFYFLAPNLITIFFILIFMIPTTFRMQMEIDLIGDYINSCIQLNHSFELIENTYFILAGKVNYSPSSFDYIRNSILEKKTKITHIFTRNQCLQLREKICLSFEKLVEYISSTNPSKDDLLYLYLPSFIDFGSNSLSVTFNNFINLYEHIPTTSSISFFIDFAFVCISVISLYLFYGSYFSVSFNSLFHFPELFLKKKKKRKKNVKNNNFDNNKSNEISIDRLIDDPDNGIPIPILPSVVLKVVSVLETDEIYSISENAAVILNRPVPSFIGEKFNETFQPILDDEPKLLVENSFSNDVESSYFSSSVSQFKVSLREHIMPDRVKKKIFKSLTKKNGVFLISLLIEDEIQGSTKPSYKQESIAERLMNYVPIYFAKKFSDDDFSEVYIDSPILVFLRIDSAKPQPELDRFFAMVNNFVMNYSAFKIIKADGGILTFCGMKKINQLILFLFIRDIISEGVNLARSVPTKVPFSVYVESIDSLKASLNTSDEPYLEISIDNLSDYETLLFKIEKNRVAFNENIMAQSAEISQMMHREVFSVGMFSRNIIWLPFDKYIELFKKYL